MIKLLAQLFMQKAAKKPKEYKGFSDFFMRASADEKKVVLTEAARRANEDQSRIFEKARLKMEVN